jgi:programmed cell death 6-interacting protein
MFIRSELRHRGVAGSDSFNRPRQLQALKLPASLDALDKPIGLPPSLLNKAEEVRLENGPERAEKLLEDVQTLARRAQTILSEVRAQLHCD